MMVNTAAGPPKTVVLRDRLFSERNRRNGQDHRYRFGHHQQLCGGRGGRPPGRDPQPGRPAHHPFGGGVHHRGRASGRRTGQAPGCDQRGAHHLEHQAQNGLRRPHPHRRQMLHPPRRSAPSFCKSSRRTPKPTSANRSPRRSSPSRPISTTPSARPPRTPGALPGSTSAASSTNPPPPRWPTGWTTARRRRSWSTTSAAAPSTSR